MPPACFLNGLSSPHPHTKKEAAQKGSLFLFFVCCIFSVSNSIHTPNGMRLESEGLSHGLKTCHRHVFLTAFRVLTHIPKKRPPKRAASFLVREMGLEPTRHNHTHLKRACLPFQHSRKRLVIITAGGIFVNSYFCFSPAKPSKQRVYAFRATVPSIYTACSRIFRNPHFS